MHWTGLHVLITGGTGSLGKALVERILPQNPARLIVLSRDELKQYEMRQRWPDGPGSAMRYFLGDVRDRLRLMRAFDGVDVVIHAAALKQVPALEYNPMEAVSTNLLGTANVIETAIDRSVGRVLLISTDKAVAPTNLYGATKLVAEKLMIQANSYAGRAEVRLSVCRYGNVLGSRGSVIPSWLEERKSGSITLTDARMTRFWITMAGAVTLIEDALESMHGGEIFVPKLPSACMSEVAHVIAPTCNLRMLGIRPGEKLHETLVSEHEGRHTIDAGVFYIILPEQTWWRAAAHVGQAMPDGWEYGSDTNGLRLDANGIADLLAQAGVKPGE